jgi:hypothetical protein
MGKKTKRAIVIITVSILFFAVLKNHTSREKSRAASFLGSVSSLRLGSSTVEEVRQLVREYSGKAEQPACTSASCVYFFSFNNGWIHDLRLAPRTRLTCTLGVEDGVLKYRHIFYTSGNTSAAFGAFIEERLSSPKGVPEPFYVSRQSDKSGAHWRIHVEMTAAASPEQHRLAYGFDLKCLSRIGGPCDAQKLLPTLMWQTNS